MNASMRTIRFRPPVGDNYQYVLAAGSECLVVDPFDENRVFECLEREQIDPQGVILTHTHWDHINGLQGFLNRHDVPVYVHPNGVSDIAAANVETVVEGDQIALGQEMLDVWYTPGHHPAHITVRTGELLVVGDVLFLAGCGNPNFGGNLPDLFTTVWERIRTADPGLKIAWGHDYADKNLSFARHVEPENTDIESLASRIDAARNQGNELPWLTIADELLVNPFLRCDQPGVIAAAQKMGAESTAPRDIFVALRNARDSF